MAFSRHLTSLLLVFFVALSLFASADASFLDTLRQKITAFTTTPTVETAHAVPDAPVQKPKREGKRVAIIGAGSAGASSAYYLRRALRNSTVDSLPVEITVFDKHSYVGGRSTTVNAYNDPTLPIELGASIFVSVNENLVSAADELGLTYASAEASSRSDDPQQDTLGIFDGKDMVFTFPSGKWWTLAKLIYRYGPLAPWRTKKLTDDIVGKFLQMYHAPLFPFPSLSDAVEAAGLLPATGTTGEQFLEANGIAGPFAQELIQASTRVNYGQNLGLIHGVETMVCMAAEGAMSIQGGNWRIFSGMVAASDADLKLQTAVTKIARVDGEWVVSWKTDGKEEQSEVYDAVVIAGPLQYAQLAIEPELKKVPDVIPYASVHVTLFASPLKLDPVFFGLAAGQSVPTAVLTTLNQTEREDPGLKQGEGKYGVGNSGFFSVSTLEITEREVPDGSGTTRLEYIYKIFSPEYFANSRVLEMLGAKEADAAVTWVHRHMWKAYPYERPRVTFEEIKLAEGLWYTAGIESFISTMETSSLMGKNVAQLIVDGWSAEKELKEKEKAEEERMVLEAAAAAAAAEEAREKEAQVEEVKEEVKDEVKEKEEAAEKESVNAEL